MGVIQLKEYDFLPLQGTSGDGQTSITKKQIALLDAITKKLSCNAFLWSYKGIKCQNWCGAIALGKDVIEILPKIYGHENETGSCRKILSNMLYVTKKLTTKKLANTDLNTQNHHILDIYISHFCFELLKQLKMGPIKQYVSRKENISILKGKLSLPEQLKLNFIQKSRFYCRFDEFVHDNDYNQILKWTLVKLAQITSNNKLTKTINELLILFDTVRTVEKTPKDVDMLPTNRIVSRYGEVFSLCKLFLSNSCPDIYSGKHNAISVLFDMNRLFEEFISVKLKKLASQFNLRIRHQGPKQYFTTHLELNTNLFRLIPDITVVNEETGKIAAIIDTKWKLLDYSDSKFGISQSDMYQIYAYSTQYECENIYLLYPFHNGIGNTPISLRVKVGNQTIKIRTVDICLLNEKNEVNFNIEIANILSEIKSASAVMASAEKDGQVF